jgi:hypothetical protein
VIAPEHQQALVIDASFIPKSGTRTYGLEHFRNSRHRRSEPTTVPMASVSSRHPQATRPLSHKAHASMPNLLERISQHLAQEHSLEKSSPDYQDLCNYGTITDRAA